MQTLEAIEVEDEVAENLRLEAEASGKTVPQIVAERLRASVKPGIGTRMNLRFREVGLQDHEHIDEMRDDGFTIPNFNDPSFDQ